MNTVIQKLETYERMHDILSDMIESGRLRRCDIPEDYDALVGILSAPVLQQETPVRNLLVANAQ